MLPAKGVNPSESGGDGFGSHPRDFLMIFHGRSGAEGPIFSGSSKGVSPLKRGERDMVHRVLIRVSFAAVLAAFILGGVPALALEKTVLKLGWVPNGESLGYYVAIDQGYYKAGVLN